MGDIWIQVIGHSTGKHQLKSGIYKCASIIKSSVHSTLLLEINGTLKWAENDQLHILSELEAYAIKLQSK